MAGLCSAYFGRKSYNLRQKEKRGVTHQYPDEVYGFVRNTSSTRKPLTFNSSRKSFAGQDFESEDHDRADSGFGSRCTSVDGSPTTVRSKSANKDFRNRPYPKCSEEVADFLENSNTFCPANIPMIVIQDYTPTGALKSRDDIQVILGTLVNALYKCHGWVFVRTAEEQMGFVPYGCLQAVGVRKPNRSSDETSPPPLPPREPISRDSISETSSYREVETPRQVHSARDISNLRYIPPRQRNPVMVGSNFDVRSDVTDEGLCEDIDVSRTDVKPRRLTVIFAYRAKCPGDVTVAQYEVVTLLNDYDPDWCFVRTDSGAEGFLPRNRTTDLQSLHLDPYEKTTLF